MGIIAQNALKWEFDIENQDRNASLYSDVIRDMELENQLTAHTDFQQAINRQRPPQKRWELLPSAPVEFITEITSRLQLSPLTAQLLYNRHLITLHQIEYFFNADYSSLADPFLIKGMGVAVARIKRGLQDHERIAIYGDFDADGVTACSLLVQFFRSVEAEVVPRIPHRVDEGYGLNPSAISRLAASGVRLIITVDCGVSNVAEVELARELGLDIIITDHHRPPPVLPSALTILNTRQPGDEYPDKGLTGVGVAFHLVRALTKSGVRPTNGLKPKDLLDLVALGTVADIGPLTGENRVLVQKGLRALNTTTRPGIVALLEVSGLRQGNLDAASIGFGLAPRINAAGRIDDAIIAYELLLTNDLGRARELAQELNHKNLERQQLLAKILEEARAQVMTGQLAEKHKLLVLSGEGWTAGVVGLVAGRLCEEYNRPVLVLEWGPQMCKGSARSIPNFNIIEALSDCADLLERFGGHKQAAGFSIKPEKLPELTHRLEAIAETKLAQTELQPRLEIDAEIELSEFVAAFQAQQVLAPFGSENVTPLFLTRNLNVREARPVGAEGAHLRLRLYDPRTGISSEGICFREGLRAAELYLNRKVDVAYSIEPHEWMGQSTLQMRVRDIHTL